MPAGLGKIQVETVTALFAIEIAKPGRAVTIPQLASLIFDTGKLTEAQRITVTRALGSLEKEGLVARNANGPTTRDVRWRLHSNVVRTIIRPAGTSKDIYSKRVRRWLKK